MSRTETAANAASSTAAPFFNQQQDFKLIPIVIALVSFCSIGIMALCILTLCNMRRMRRMLNEQRTRPVERNAVGQSPKAEERKLPSKPMMITIKLEDGSGIKDSKVDWSDVMPLGADIVRIDPNNHHSSYEKATTGTQHQKDTEELTGEAQVALSVLITLPSALNERYPTNNGWMDANKSSTSILRFVAPHRQIPMTVIGSSSVKLNSSGSFI